jgi:DNA (cytosine-5)-methyltransferase 1
MLESGIIVPEYIARKPKRLTAFDFFCGAGGFGLGFLTIDSAYEIVGANEWDAAAAITYLTNLGNYPVQIHYIEGKKDKDRLDEALMREWGIKGAFSADKANKAWGDDLTPDKFFCAGSGWFGREKEKGRDVPGVKNFWFGDVRKLKGKDILDTLGMKQGDIDVVTGGPPCQGFSRSGKQVVGDPRNNLVYEYARMIVELQPKTFIMEEVPDVLNFFDPDGVPVLDKFCMILEEGDYGKWDLIKKSLLAQAGSAGVIKDGLKRHKINQRKKKANEEQPHSRELFDFDNCGEG